MRKVAGRNGELVERWLYDDSGRLCGYLYVGNHPVGEGLADTGEADQRTLVSTFCDPEQCGSWGRLFGVGSEF